MKTIAIGRRDGIGLALEIVIYSAFSHGIATMTIAEKDRISSVLMLFFIIRRYGTHRLIVKFGSHGEDDILAADGPGGLCHFLTEHPCRRPWGQLHIANHGIRPKRERRPVAALRAIESPGVVAISRNIPGVIAS